jgi:hypothetical protein
MYNSENRVYSGSIVDSMKRYRALAQMYGRDIEVYYI